MPATQAAPDLMARIQTVKRLFPIYLIFTERFGLPKPPVADARALKPNSDPSVIESAEKWMEDLDQKIDAFQLRSVVQGSNVGASELRILALLERLLGKPNPDSADRSKIDFLLAQLLATRLTLHGEQTPTLADVAEVLEPVIGKINAAAVDSVPALESLISELLSARRLIEVKQKSIIERGREVKNGLADSALLPKNLIACSRFNFLLRKRCFELMKEEVKLIKSGLERLSEKGLIIVDCTTAKMSAEETIPGLIEMCRGWQERTPDNYAHDNPFSQVLVLQEIVEKALAEAPEEKTTTAPIAPGFSGKHVEEPLKPTPDVIQIYAELAQLRREHHQVADKVYQQETEIKDLRHTLVGFREDLERTAEQYRKLQGLVAELRHEIDTARQEVTASVVSSAPVASTPSVNVGEGPAPASVKATKPPVAQTEPIVTVKTPSMQEIFQSMAHRMEEIREALLAAKVNVKKEAPTHLKLNHVSIMLTASETQAFFSPPSQADELICRGVAARFLLLETTKDMDKEPSAAKVETILTVCEAGASQLHEQAAHLPPEQAERVLETAQLLSKTLKGFAKK